ncbi:MAG: hypothetical protein K2G24_03325, partial [Muribaculaceae bacterium]|nr:hypothetical protein [Muribaculaceae bacterium]
KNYPLRTEAGKGGCALYFSLNERAVVFFNVAQVRGLVFRRLFQIIFVILEIIITFAVQNKMFNQISLNWISTLCRLASRL